VLAAAGRLAAQLAPGLTPLSVRDFDPASRRLGAAIFEVADGKARYGSAFEALADGAGRLAEEALFRAATRVLPCTPAAVEQRAQAFLSRFPASARAPLARLQLARALEEEHWQGGGRDALKRAVQQYGLVARGKGPEAVEAAERARDLSRPRPARPGVSRIRCE